MPLAKGRLSEWSMKILRRRSRLVTFRVSAEEYDDLYKWCMISGARSMSDFAREAIQQNVQALRNSAGSLNGDLATLGRTLSELDDALGDVRKRIRGVLGRPGTEEGNRAEKAH